MCLSPGTESPSGPFLHRLGLADQGILPVQQGQSLCSVGLLLFLGGEVMLFLCLEPSFTGQKCSGKLTQEPHTDSEPTRVIISQPLLRS